MIRKKTNEEMIDDLYEVLTTLSDKKQCRALLEDLCTNGEVEKMAQRLRAARLLMEGCTYQQVIEETDISSATLSRVSHAVQYGTGYRAMLAK